MALGEQSHTQFTSEPPTASCSSTRRWGELGQPTQAPVDTATWEYERPFLHPFQVLNSLDEEFSEGEKRKCLSLACMLSLETLEFCECGV